MPSSNTHRIAVLVLATVLVMAPVSFAAASPVTFDAPAIQTSDDGGFFSWAVDWFQGLVNASDSVVAPGTDVVGPPEPSDGLSDGSTEERDRGAEITVDG